MKKIFLCFLLFVVSCSSPKVSLLDNSTCELPCWNNIIPGATTYSDVLQIVPTINGVDVSKTKDLGAPWQIYSQRIQFYLYTDPSVAKVYSDGEVYFINDKVAMLLLQRNIGRTFGELSEMTGEPERIISVPFPHGPSVFAINLSKGIAFVFLAKSDNLEANTSIDTVMLFDPAQYQNLLEDGMFSWSTYNAEETLKAMHPWKGYGKISELYPQ